MEEILPRHGLRVDVIRRFETFVELQITKENESIKVDLAYDSPFRFQPPADTELGIKVNSYQDIITDKLLTFFGRWKHRDAIDLYFILRKERLGALMKFAAEKDPGFDTYWFCAALNEVNSFPDKIGEWQVEMLVDIDINNLKRLFKKIGNKLMKQLDGN